jgi:hypothetical protein
MHLSSSQQCVHFYAAPRAADRRSSPLAFFPCFPPLLQAPGYFSVITQPMDFSTMRGKAQRGEYAGWEELRADMRCAVGVVGVGGGHGGWGGCWPAGLLGCRHAVPSTTLQYQAGRALELPAPWPLLLFEQSVEFHPPTHAACPPLPHLLPPCSLMFSNALRFNAENGAIHNYAKLLAGQCDRIVELAMWVPLQLAASTCPRRLLAAWLYCCPRWPAACIACLSCCLLQVPATSNPRHC